MNPTIASAIVAFGLVSLSFVEGARADEPPASPEPEVAIHAAGAAEIDEHERDAAPLPGAAPVSAPLAPRVERVVYTGPTTRPRSRGLMYGGIATGLAGVVALAGGLAIHTQHLSSLCTHPPSTAYVWPGAYAAGCGASAAQSGLVDAGKDLLIAFGGGMAAAGVVMAVVGDWQVPITPRSKGGAPMQQRPEAAVIVGSTSASLRISF